MTASNLISDYIQYGLHSARPASPNVPAGASAIYYETDTTDAFIWSGTAWKQIVGSGGGGSNPAIVQSGFAAGSISGVTLGTAPTAGNVIIAFMAGSSGTAGTGWNLFFTDNGGVSQTTAYWKVAGVSESATQNPLPSPGTCAIGMYEVSGNPFAAVVGLDTAGTSITKAVVSPRSTDLIIGCVFDESTGVLPTGFTGATADGTATNGSSRSVAGFHIGSPSAGSNSITANWATSHNLRFAGIAVCGPG